MANRNHDLDKPIIEAAKMEFLQNGFRSASIGNIAKRAGVTTGAIYTRYKGKDELLALDNARKENEKAYGEYCTDKNFNNFLNNIAKETAGYVDILFEHYDACKLLLCQSNGSSVEEMLNKRMENKISETKTFIKENIAPDISDMKLALVELLINQQFDAYTLVIKKGYSKEETVEYIKMLGEFIVAGWEKLFKDIVK